MKLDVKRFFLLGILLILAACNQADEVEQAVKSDPTVEAVSPTQEATATAEPTNTPEPTATLEPTEVPTEVPTEAPVEAPTEAATEPPTEVPAEAAEEPAEDVAEGTIDSEAGDDTSAEDVVSLFGDVVTEGVVNVPAAGIQFEVPTGWSAISMMGFIGVATNESVEVALGDGQTINGVLVMLMPADGDTLDEAWESTSEDMLSSMTGIETGLSEEDIETLEERVPVTINGYSGERTSLRVTEDGTVSFVEMNILAHEGSTYLAVYAGEIDSYESEKPNADFLLNSLVLSEPDPSAISFGDLGEGDGELYPAVSAPDETEPLAVNSTVAFNTDSTIGYKAEVEVGTTYFIYLHGDADLVLNLFPEDGTPLDSIDSRYDNSEAILWTADAPSLAITGSFYSKPADPQPLKLSIFEAVNLETASQTVEVKDGESYFVIGFEDESDVKLVVGSGLDAYSNDSADEGGVEFERFDQAGSYEVSLTDWADGESLGQLFLVTLPNDECCTLP